MEECERDDILELYEKSGYFSLKTRVEIQRSTDCWKTTCGKLRNKRQVSANLVYDSNGKLLTAASALRIYDKTFLGHQLASLPEARLNMKSKTDVYFVMSDFLIDHLYCDHYLTYFDTHNPWHREVCTKMGAFIDDENKFIFDEMEMFEYKAGRRKSLTAQKGYTVEVPDSPAEFLGYCKKSMKPVERDCYDYDEGSFSLSRCRSFYLLCHPLRLDDRMHFAFSGYNKIIKCNYNFARAVGERILCENAPVTSEVCRLMTEAGYGRERRGDGERRRQESSQGSRRIAAAAVRDE